MLRCVAQWLRPINQLVAERHVSSATIRARNSSTVAGTGLPVTATPIGEGTLTGDGGDGGLRNSR